MRRVLKINNIYIKPLRFACGLFCFLFMAGYSFHLDAKPIKIYGQNVEIWRYGSEFSSKLVSLDRHLKPVHLKAPVLKGDKGVILEDVEDFVQLQFPEFNRKISSEIINLRNPALVNEKAGDAVALQADKLVHDDKEQVITASGNVVLEQNGRILSADEVLYNLKTDIVIARGNVVLREINKDVHYADYVELNDKMKNGFIQGLKTYLHDGSRFIAREGVREGGDFTTMKEVIYTPCEPCKNNPDKSPVWQIKASEVSHDEQEKRISYKHARFEVLGVPVAYMPYFSHPDGSVKRKSGFLSPSAGFKSELGGFVENNYYWNIAPDKDATIGLIAMTEEAPLVFGEYRQRWGSAALSLNGGVTYSGRVENKAGLDERQEEELRGHVFAKGLWDINNKWRAGTDIAWASDDQYMSQYDFTDDDVLEGEFYVERFSGRDYAVGRVLAFQDVRVRDMREDQPEVLPEVMLSFLGEPGFMPVIGGRWGLEASLLGLHRSGEDQDMTRMSLEAGWNRRLVSDYGLLTSVDTIMRGDVYNTRDRDVATVGSGRSTSSREARFFPNLHVQSSYPVAKDFERMQVTIEPVVALTLAGNIDVNSDIPNEDSQDVQLDASNIFEPNRFPGMDRVEDKSRITYGVRTGLYGYGGSYGNVFLGQSYRLDDDDNPFPKGSGLDKQESDVVGQFSAVYGQNYNFDYRFQLASDDLSSRRHEVDVYAKWNRLALGSNYLYASALDGTDISESREQLKPSLAYYVTKDWRLRTGATQDLGDNPGLREAYLGLDYFGQCLSWSVTGEKNLTDDSSGESEIEILFRIGLKNLGEFESSGLRVGHVKE